MRITAVGAGPASLYFSILMKQAFPEVEIELHERNEAGATFGWGVVFSDETLGHFEQADPQTYEAITREFAYWTDIDTWVHDQCVRSTGHGFCGMSRKRLLEIFTERARALGVTINFEHEIEDPLALADADLLIAGDGLRSVVREQWKEHFRPTLDWRHCRFTWLGTSLPLDAFTFIFRENEHGLFQVHAYPFQRNLSTFIVECHADTWERAGLDKASEVETVAYMEALFADHLKGHRLLTNMSIWRAFPTVRNERLHHENVVLLGDAAHTAHFSIGSGTKLAMEDAIALVEAFRAKGLGDVPAALQAYEDMRGLEALKLQKAAQTSLEWFENSARYMHQDPVTFTFNLMSRSKRITYDNLTMRDPAFMARVTQQYAERQGLAAGAEPPPPAFVPFTVKGLTLHNRLVVSPMCQYSAVEGSPTAWHQVHLGSLAVGGAGLVFTEMTNVSPDARITHGCAGIYTDEHEAAWKQIVTFAHEHSRALVGLQLGHAGRKGSCTLPWNGDRPIQGEGAWTCVGPSALPFDQDWPSPREMDRGDMDRTLEDYRAATARALRAGFDVIELHMAHGYLLSSFLSPLSNQRSDAYGGDLAGRARFPLEVLAAVREVWGEERPLFVRVSATDWLDDAGGLTIADSVALAHLLKAAGCDVIDVSSGGNVPHSAVEYGRMYQVPFAERIRHEVQIPVMAVGAILGADHANTIIAAGRADLCALARPHLRNPHLSLDESARYFAETQPWPLQYVAARPRRKTEPVGLAQILRDRRPRIRYGARDEPTSTDA
jgi:anthraniloyl-CoA monooxygenase